MLNQTPAQDQPAVLSLGSINADFQVRVERRPEVSETLIGKDFARFAGGKAANVAVMATRFGCPSRLFGRVGDDDLAEQALGPVRAAGVDVAGVVAVAGQHTGVSLITVPPDGKKGIVLATNANDAWREADLPALCHAIEAAAEGSVLALNAEVPAFVSETAARAARRAGLCTVLDPSPADQVSDVLLAAASVICPNPGEAKTLTGIEVDSPEAALEAGRALLERGVQTACMKLGDGGCVVVSADSAHCVATVEADVVDTTGAGDAFAGALAAALAQGHPPLAATQFAVATAHFAVTEYGSQTALPERAQIDALRQQLCDRTHALQH